MTRGRAGRKGGVLDADHLQDRLEEDLRWTADRAGGAEVRLYRRTSSSIRVESDTDGRWSTRRGEEEGTALEIWSPDEDRVRFAAATGASKETIRGLIDLITGSGGVENRELAQPLADDPGRIDDRDRGMALPEAARLVDWLDGAGRRIGPGARPMWIEVAQTVENWAGSGGLRATRCRCRGGSMVHSESTRPFLIAARHWSGLDPGAFEILRDDRIAPDKRGAATGLPPLLLLSPECAGALAVSLARRVHGDPTFLKRPAGPGWCLEDRPDAPEAIYGGAFDDLGLPTRPRTLADGKAIRDLITGPGSFRRPAFRDPPQPAPAHLVLRPPELEMPARFAAVTGLSLHPLPADRWMLELAGVFFEGGEAALGFDGSIVSTTPSRLIESCTGAVGPARPSYRGVVTPGLLFDAPGET